MKEPKPRKKMGRPRKNPEKTGESVWVPGDLLAVVAALKAASAKKEPPK